MGIIVFNKGSEGHFGCLIYQDLLQKCGERTFRARVVESLVKDDIELATMPSIEGAATYFKFLCYFKC